jgi:hypothetical protein
MNTSMNSEIDVINKKILHNKEEKKPWVTLYEEKRRKWGTSRKEFI